MMKSRPARGFLGLKGGQQMTLLAIGTAALAVIACGAGAVMFLILLPPSPPIILPTLYVAPTPAPTAFSLYPTLPPTWTPSPPPNAAPSPTGETAVVAGKTPAAITKTPTASSAPADAPPKTASTLPNKSASPTKPAASATSTRPGVPSPTSTATTVALPTATPTPAPPPPTATYPPLPPGSLLAFVTDRDNENRNLYMMNATGGGITQITNHDPADDQPSWSPDGYQLVYISQIEVDSERDPDGNGMAWKIHFISVNGADRRQLNTGYSEFADEFYPAWSPDGRLIVFCTGGKLATINIDGTDRRELITGPRPVGNPDWSPDGQWLAVEMAMPNGRTHIFKLRADGTGLTQLTNDDNRGNNSMPDWSPDGSRIAFVSDRDGNLEIYVMRADGNEQTRLTYYEEADHSPNWSPDGTRLAFVTETTSSEIFIMRADGTGRINISRASSQEEWPIWRPTGGAQ